ncbi:MAG: 2-hydroxycyclohexanecarboxyl-CoA dehydrogenase, partial [Pseudonocardiales bacterium]|nr:2-hydroxycyclohexanecarboxyl-CoA dehydrogenase [Pseudonocardiales bacterium]
MDFSGKVAVVTGAASGIGRAVAIELARGGATLAAIDKDVAGARQVVAELGGIPHHAFEVDLTERDALVDLAAKVESAVGEVSIVVNVAGWDVIEPFLSNSREYWDQLVALNFMAPVEICRAFLERMTERDMPGRIVNVASDAGRVGSSGETVYAGAKGGVIAFSKSLAREMARHQITVNAVCPGPTDTPLFRSQPQKMQDALIRAIPLRRL